MPHLFSELKIKDVTLRNRIGVSPMCQYSYQDGMGDDWLFNHLGSRAVGGAALVISEATAVEARGRISPQDLGIWKDDHIAPLERATKFIKLQGAVPGIQLAHAGRKACTIRPWEGRGPVYQGDPLWWRAVGPSPIAFAENYQIPHELSKEEIKQIQNAFRDAAVRALAAGFEWLEIHGAHGYLINNFLSPISNQRSDEYGGSFENRIRFFLETIQQIRQVWPEHFPLTVRISGTEWVEGGWRVEDSIALARILEAEGIDLIDCSSGGNVSTAVIPAGPGYQVPISEAIKRETNMRTATVGLITAPTHADEIIRNERADVVLLGRAVLADPYWPLHAAQLLKQPSPIPAQYLRGF